MRTSFEVPGAPMGKGRPRFVGTRAISDPKTAEYENWMRLQFINQVPAAKRMHEGPLIISIEADFEIPQSWSKVRKRAAEEGKILPTKKPDLDNIVKCIDALNGIAWHDDAQIVGIIAKKRYTSSPKVVITIEEVDAAEA